VRLGTPFSRLTARSPLDASDTTTTMSSEGTLHRLTLPRVATHSPDARLICPDFHALSGWFSCDITHSRREQLCDFDPPLSSDCLRTFHQ